jgi:hypothetical protein
VGFYKCVQSAGWCIGFAFSPPTRLAPVAQMGLSAALGLLGAALMLARLPPPGRGDPAEADATLPLLLSDEMAADGLQSFENT